MANQQDDTANQHDDTVNQHDDRGPKNNNELQGEMSRNDGKLD